MNYPTSLLPVFEDEVFKINIDPELAILQLSWQQHPTSEAYRKGYRQAIAVATAYKTKFWLTDARRVNYLHRADQYWMYSKMLPLLNKAKLLRFALLLQPEVYLMTDRKPVLNSSDENAKRPKPINIEFFLDMNSAQLWLMAGN